MHCACDGELLLRGCEVELKAFPVLARELRVVAVSIMGLFLMIYKAVPLHFLTTTARKVGLDISIVLRASKERESISYAAAQAQATH